MNSVMPEGGTSRFWDSARDFLDDLSVGSRAGRANVAHVSAIEQINGSLLPNRYRLVGM